MESLSPKDKVIDGAPYASLFDMITMPVIDLEQTADTNEESQNGQDQQA